MESAQTFELGTLQSYLDQVFEQVKTIDPNSDAFATIQLLEMFNYCPKNILNQLDPPTHH